MLVDFITNNNSRVVLANTNTVIRYLYTLINFQNWFNIVTYLRRFNGTKTSTRSRLIQCCIKVVSMGTCRHSDVDAMSSRRIDISKTSFRRQVPAGNKSMLN